MKSSKSSHGEKLKTLKIVKLKIGILILATIATQISLAGTTIQGIGPSAKVISLVSKTDGVVQRIFAAGKSKYGTVAGKPGLALEVVRLPKTDLIGIGFSSEFAAQPIMNLPPLHEYYRLTMKFDFTTSSYRYQSLGRGGLLLVFGKVAEDLLAMGLVNVNGIECQRGRITACRIQWE
jgi:hypothetical protein